MNKILWIILFFLAGVLLAWASTKNVATIQQQELIDVHIQHVDALQERIDYEQQRANLLGKRNIQLLGYASKHREVKEELQSKIDLLRTENQALYQIKKNTDQDLRLAHAVGFYQGLYNLCMSNATRDKDALSAFQEVCKPLIITMITRKVEQTTPAPYWSEEAIREIITQRDIKPTY